MCPREVRTEHIFREECLATRNRSSESRYLRFATARERLAAGIATRDQAFPFLHRDDIGRALRLKCHLQQRENIRIRHPAWEPHAPSVRQCTPHPFEPAAPTRESCMRSRL